MKEMRLETRERLAGSLEIAGALLIMLPLLGAMSYTRMSEASQAIIPGWVFVLALCLVVCGAVCFALWSRFNTEKGGSMAYYLDCEDTSLSVFIGDSSEKIVSIIVGDKRATVRRSKLNVIVKSAGDDCLDGHCARLELRCWRTQSLGTTTHSSGVLYLARDSLLYEEFKDHI